MSEKDTTSSRAELDAHIFRKRLTLQLRLHEILRLLDDVPSTQCLDVGAQNGTLLRHLRRGGGVWHSVAFSEDAEQTLVASVGENVHRAEPDALPFEDKTFDAIVLFDCLHQVEHDEAFITECHRVLKADGRLIVNVPNAKSWSLLAPVQAVLQQTPEDLGYTRRGYTESELFRVLKHGFDVYQVRSFSRFFVELTDAVVQWYCRRLARDGRDTAAALKRVYSVSGPFYWLADQLDLLLLLTRGYSLIAIAKRRTWRPRKAPVLVDGRSISEAVLSRPAD